MYTEVWAGHIITAHNNLLEWYIISSKTIASPPPSSLPLVSICYYTTCLSGTLQFSYLSVFLARLVLQSRFHCQSKARHVSGSYWVKFSLHGIKVGGGEHHFVTLMKMPCTFWQTELPPGCLLAMKLFHISFIIGERRENTSSFCSHMSKLAKTTETPFH